VRRIVDEHRRIEAPMQAAATTQDARRLTAARTRAARFSPSSGEASGGAFWAPPELLFPRSHGSRTRTDVADIPTPQARSERVTRDAPAAPLDLDRLTDQVVRKIDRRIVAERERVGRF
jgi:hypothetical protein